MNPKNNFEIYTSTDKAQRDKLFQALRTSSDPFERQAVKFSGNEPDPNNPGKFRSTWTAAHPKAENF